MSYHRPNSGDPQRDFFDAMFDFVTLWPRLTAAEDERGFVIWLDKLLLIDRTSLLLNLRKYKEQFDPHFISLAEKLLRAKIF